MPRLPALSGPLPPLPAPLDAIGRAWASAGGRARALVRLVAVVVLCLAAAGGLVRGPWGPPVTVVVTAHAVPEGAPVTSDDVTRARRPAGLVPDGALTDAATLPADALAAGPLPAGTTLTTELLHAGGPSSLATPGTAVVAVPAELLPALPVGARLDVAAPSPDGTARIAARDAEVVADDGTWRWLRVGRGEVAGLAGAVSDGRVVAAVLPP